MGSGKRRHNAKAKVKAKKKKGRVKPHAVPTGVHDLPDELLDRVLLGLGSPLHLIRAAATCRRWRRSIADGDFLVRYRSLHGAPPVAGHYYVTDTLPPWATDRWYRTPVKPAVFVPSSPAVVDSAHFSLDFLYEAPVGDDRPRYMYQYGNRTRHNRCREIVDSRGSLLLLRRWPLWVGDMDGRHCASDFVVCEPLTRRCQGIVWPLSLRYFQFLGAFLLDGGGGVSDDAMSNFRVVLVLYERDRPQGGIPRACLFTPGCDGGWRLGWHPTDDAVTLQVDFVNLIHFAGRAAGRIFWGIETGDVLVLDEGTLEFSLLELPSGMRWPYRKTSFRVIGGAAGGDTVRVVRVDGEDLQIFGQLPWSGEWVMEKSVRLSDAATGLPWLEEHVFHAAGKDRHGGRHVRGGDADGEAVADLRRARYHGAGARA
ncbi:hypothetical protein EJB05_53709, partial [Eragrostis curvula]